MSETTIMEVVVHKASLPLLKAETLAQFTNSLSGSGREYLRRKYNLQKFDDVWMAEVMVDKAIFSIFKDKPNDGVRMRHYAVKYNRDIKKGTFEFGETKEVRRMTVFEPIDSTSEKAVAKAAWTAASINNLPDAAFAVILPGGKKDKEGKTVPRSLRMLPHHNANVKSPSENSSVDLPHLRNGLARASQSKMPAADKAKAIAHLQAHAKELLKTAKTEKACKPKKGADDSAWVSKGVEYTQKEKWVSADQVVEWGGIL
jgi:hypothetical protein